MDANKNSLPEAPDELAGLVAYKVHGMFASREGARVFPDTFMFSARELKDPGFEPCKRKEKLPCSNHDSIVVVLLAPLGDRLQFEASGWQIFCSNFVFANF